MIDMEKEFERPELIIVYFTDVDIITSSADPVNDEGEITIPIKS